MRRGRGESCRQHQLGKADLEWSRQRTVTHPRVLGHSDEEHGVDDGKDAREAVRLDRHADDALDDRRRSLVVVLGRAAQVEDAASRESVRLDIRCEGRQETYSEPVMRMSATLSRGQAGDQQHLRENRESSSGA